MNERKTTSKKNKKKSIKQIKNMNMKTKYWKVIKINKTFINKKNLKKKTTKIFINILLKKMNDR